MLIHSYYFDSKEKVMDALVEREYENIISDCKKKLDDCNLNANWFLPFVFTFLMDDGIFNWTL